MGDGLAPDWRAQVKCCEEDRMRRLLNILPWIALLAIGAISLPKMARTAPPPEAHPHMRAAMRELRETRRELETAAHDFCGHKADAIRTVDESIRQLQLALDCAR
jgi:hypothetical protein